MRSSATMPNVSASGDFENFRSKENEFFYQKILKVAGDGAREQFKIDSCRLKDFDMG